MDNKDTLPTVDDIINSFTSFSIGIKNKKSDSDQKKDDKKDEVKEDYFNSFTLPEKDAHGIINWNNDTCTDAENGKYVIYVKAGNLALVVSKYDAKKNNDFSLLMNFSKFDTFDSYDEALSFMSALTFKDYVETRSGNFIKIDEVGIGKIIDGNTNTIETKDGEEINFVNNRNHYNRSKLGNFNAYSNDIVIYFELKDTYKDYFKGFEPTKGWLKIRNYSKYKIKDVYKFKDFSLVEDVNEATPIDFGDYIEIVWLYKRLVGLEYKNREDAAYAAFDYTMEYARLAQESTSKSKYQKLIEDTLNEYSSDKDENWIIQYYNDGYTSDFSETAYIREYDLVSYNPKTGEPFDKDADYDYVEDYESATKYTKDDAINMAKNIIYHDLLDCVDSGISNDKEIYMASTTWTIINTLTDEKIIIDTEEINDIIEKELGDK